MTDDRLADLVAPLRAAPDRAAVLLDVDGTLAPITRHAGSAEVPPPTRGLLTEVAARFGMVACVSGRRAVDARRIVGIGSLHYVGNHGTEILRRGAREIETTPAVAAWEPRVREIARTLLASRPDLDRLGISCEDKGPIQALHWRGAPDEAAAEAVVDELGERAEAEGLVLHRGRMVLELRPPVAFDKGAAVRWLVAGGGYDAALYAGDDRTDLDAFAGLRRLVDEGGLAAAICVAVRDGDAPAEVSAAADLTVDGSPGIRSVLQELLRP
ncbi:Trehalose-6-phosphate phosphatase [Patulibacter medicamentivorans]|uniref:Trehalose 6-phosphate phosphatase n=1 Tax=Patulibacter medicamentivorans TaxID=1097667 RepID=H0E8W5_9ACTN|nr:trehalose-phosphatase [Patulibacter medicamentivorans]EHN09865.1 Trehalose-6-phosphate phosphatase [Patulibacter medicamentivorans]